MYPTVLDTKRQKIFARHKHNLVLVARNGRKSDPLAEELRQKYGVEVLVLAQDLSLPHATTLIFEQVQHKNIRIDLLVNNAGFGNFGFL